MIKCIQFINRYPVISTQAASQTVTWKFSPVTFQLGMGPCGKVVTHMDYRLTDKQFSIIQRCEDGEVKHFVYQMEDIAGRIVIEEAKNV